LLLGLASYADEEEVEDGGPTRSRMDCPYLDTVN
jgi:hypothetical protein